jgi:hypothetical protein
MFKKALILALFLIFCCSVFSVRLIDPVSLVLSEDSKDLIGSVALGNKIELIFSKELVNKYTGIELLSVLPNGFSYSVEEEIDSIKLFVSVSKDAVVGYYPFKIKLIGPNGSDVVSFTLRVGSNLLDVSPSEIFEQAASVDSPVVYKLAFSNRSDGDGLFVVSSDLPSNWLGEDIFSKALFSRTIIVPRGKMVEESFTVYPRLQGEKQFNLIVDFEDTQRSFAFSVDAAPTLKSKLETVFYGLPFYSFSLLPDYFLGGLFSFFLN